MDNVQNHNNDVDVDAVSCPTRLSLYCYLNFCDDHLVDNIGDIPGVSAMGSILRPP